MTNSKRTIINLSCSILVLLVNVSISFWLSPYIISHIGIEANGFVSMANNFVTYANLIVLALNSMAARFITIAYEEKDYKKADLYYNSVFWGNLIICLVLLIPAIILIVFFENLFDVPNDILFDVKILFSLVFMCFFLNTAAPNWDVGTYVSNRLDRTYIPDAINQIFRAGIIFGSLTLFIPKAWYIGVASLFTTVFALVVNCVNTHRLTPELKIKLKRGQRVCSWKAIKELVGSGLWNSISNLGNMLLSGLDLIVCNTLLGATPMGVLATSKTLFSLLQLLSSSLTRSFGPELVISYSHKNDDEIKQTLFRSMKLTGTIMTIATAGCIMFSYDFFKLWVPSQDAKVLATLSIISFLGYTLTASIQILYNVFPTVNRVKENAIAQVSSGVISVLLTIILVKFTDYGIYAIAGVSTLINTIRNLSFTIPMAAEYLGFKKSAFYPVVLRTFISVSIICGFSYLILHLISINNWLTFIGAAAIVSLFGLVLNMFILLSKSDRAFLKNKIKTRISKIKK